MKKHRRGLTKATVFKTSIKELKAKKFFLLFIAGFVNAFGVTVFIAPVMLYDSGISGTSILFSQITPDPLTLSFFLLVLNIPLFLFGLKKQGLTFTIYCIFTVMCYSLGSWLITEVLPIDVTMSSPLAGTDLLLCAVFGGIISGAGSGLAIRFGGAMDGVEVMAVIFAKRIGITVGTFVMGYNVLLYTIAGVINGSWVLPLYSIITYCAGLKTVDFIVEGFDRAKAAIIITDKGNEVCKALSDFFENGITTLDAHSYYSDTDRKAVYIVVNRFQIGRMKELVYKQDPKAYITISEVADVFKANK